MSTVFDMLSSLVAARLAVGDYAPIRAAYRSEIWGCVEEYLTTEGARVTKYRNQFMQAVSYAFDQAAKQGWADGGGGTWPKDADKEDLAWETERLNEELGHVEKLFQTLKELKADGPDSYEGESDKRADGYARTLDAIYSEAKIRAAKNTMLTFGGEDGQESCKTCQKWKAKRHKASFWLKRGLIPGQPGNVNFECGGWQCMHILYDDQGKVFTI
jgi:hypothetical protein